MPSQQIIYYCCHSTELETEAQRGYTSRPGPRSKSRQPGLNPGSLAWSPCCWLSEGFELFSPQGPRTGVNVKAPQVTQKAAETWTPSKAREGMSPSASSSLSPCESRACLWGLAGNPSLCVFLLLSHVRLWEAAGRLRRGPCPSHSGGLTSHFLPFFSE